MLDITGMHISSRTPEGVPNHCPMCGAEVIVDPSIPPGDAPCPHCGHLLWFPPDARSELQPKEYSELQLEHLNVQRVGDVAVVSFKCLQISDAIVVAELRRELNTLIEATLLSDSKKVLLDFANVGYLSSAFLGMLITFDKRAKAESCHMHMCNLRPDILEIFQITRLDKLFTIHKNRESSLRAFDVLPDTGPSPDAGPAPDASLN